MQSGDRRRRHRIGRWAGGGCGLGVSGSDEGRRHHGPPPMPAAASSLRRLSSRLNSVSCVVMAARLLHSCRGSLSQLDDSPANRPQTDPVVFGRGEAGSPGLGAPWAGSIGSNWVRMGVPEALEVNREMDIGRWTSYAGTMLMAIYFMPFAPNRQTVGGVRDLVWGSGIPDESRTDTLFVSIMPHFGVHYFRCPTNPWGVGRASGVV